MFFLFSHLLWVYFYLPVFRRSDCSGSIATATVTAIATATAIVIVIVTLHNVILLWVYFYLPTNVDISADVVFNVHTSQVM